MTPSLLGFGIRSVDICSPGGQIFSPGIGAFLPASASATATGPTGALGFGLGQFNPDIRGVTLWGDQGLDGALRTGFSCRLLDVLRGVEPDEGVVLIGYPRPGPGIGVLRTPILAGASSTPAPATPPAATLAVIFFIVTAFAGCLGNRPGDPGLDVPPSTTPAAAAPAIARVFASSGALASTIGVTGVLVVLVDKDLFLIVGLVLILDLVLEVLVRRRVGLEGPGGRRGIEGPRLVRGAFKGEVRMRQGLVDHHRDEDALVRV
jgi:hypothetical protein